MKVTREFILSGKSGAGGWTKRQLQILGVGWPPPKRWMKRVEGKTISDSAAKEFIALTGQKKRFRYRCIDKPNHTFFVKVDAPHEPSFCVVCGALATRES